MFETLNYYQRIIGMEISATLPLYKYADSSGKPRLAHEKEVFICFLEMLEKWNTN